MKKTLYTPDDPRASINTINYRKFIKENNIKLPDIMLDSWHGYFSRTVSSNLYTIAYLDNPLYFDGPQHKFSTEDSSEYHPSNINNFPKFKKYMDEFIQISALRHIEFEKIVSAQSHHQLNFTDFGIEKKNSFKKNTSKKKSSKNYEMIKQLKDLKQLFDDEILTKEEFEKAKKKLLN